jgi:hypothetical protein
MNYRDSIVARNISELIVSNNDTKFLLVYSGIDLMRFKVKISSEYEPFNTIGFLLKEHYNQSIYNVMIASRRIADGQQPHLKNLKKDYFYYTKNNLPRLKKFVFGGVAIRGFRLRKSIDLLIYFETEYKHKNGYNRYPIN